MSLAIPVASPICAEAERIKFPHLKLISMTIYIDGRTERRMNMMDVNNMQIDCCLLSLRRHSADGVGVALQRLSSGNSTGFD